MIGKPMTLAETMTAHPGPWRYTAFNGLVQTYDATGAEVPMFTILNLAVTVSIAASAPKKQESPSAA